MPDPDTPPVAICHEGAGARPGRDLLAAMTAYLAELYGPASVDETPSATPQEMTPPEGRFLVLYEGEEAVACGGVKRLGEGLAEIKRMWVVPAARSRGHARRLLTALEDAAHDLGYDRVRLDTGVLQPHARALYVSTGYEEIADYNGNPHASYWFEKRLGPAAPRSPGRA